MLYSVWIFQLRFVMDLIALAPKKSICFTMGCSILEVETARLNGLL